MHAACDRRSLKEQKETDSEPDEPIGLASDGEVDAELAKLLSEVDEVLSSSEGTICRNWKRVEAIKV